MALLLGQFPVEGGGTHQFGLNETWPDTENGERADNINKARHPPIIDIVSNSINQWMCFETFFVI